MVGRDELDKPKEKYKKHGYLMKFRECKQNEARSDAD